MDGLEAVPIYFICLWERHDDSGMPGFFFESPDACEEYIEENGLREMFEGTHVRSTALLVGEERITDD